MPLSKEEEARLVREAKEGDVQSLEKLIIEHLGLVKSIARKLCNPKINPGLFDDLVQEGTVALIEAIDCFDPAKGVQVATYAFWSIKGAMLDYIERQHWSGMNIPRPLRDLARKVGRAHDKLIQKLERQPTVEEIANAVGETSEKVEEALNLLTLEIVSLEALSEPTEEGKGAWEPISMEPLPEEVVIGGNEEIDVALRKLTPNRRQVIELRYWHDFSLKQIGEIMGRTENAVKQLLRNARKDLQEHLKGMDETQQGISADNSDGGD